MKNLRRNWRLFHQSPSRRFFQSGRNCKHIKLAENPVKINKITIIIRCFLCKELILDEFPEEEEKQQKVKKI